MLYFFTYLLKTVLTNNTDIEIYNNHLSIYFQSLIIEYEPDKQKTPTQYFYILYTRNGFSVFTQGTLVVILLANDSLTLILLSNK